MIRREHREEKWIFPFVDYSPKDMHGKLPLIVQLHGAGERGEGKEDLSLVDKHGFSKMAQNGEYECIFVMPQCPKESFWAAKVESILAFVGQIIKEYDIDETRVYLTGLSMGGYGTWYTAMAKPSMFAAIMPICGGGMAWNAKVLDMPIWVYHSADDGAVNVRNSDEMVDYLKRAGRDVTYTRMEDAGHAVWIHAYNEEMYNWLLSKRR